MNKTLFTLTVSILIFAPLLIWASNDEGQDEVSGAIGSYQKYIEIYNVDIRVPTVLEVPVSLERSSLKQFLVINDETLIPQPSYFFSSSQERRPTLSITDDRGSGNTSRLIDAKYDTYVEYVLGENGESQNVTLQIRGENLFTVASLAFQLDKNTALPSTVEVRALDANNRSKVILARSAMRSRYVPFPRTTAKTFEVQLEYSQLLRITEIELGLSELEKDTYSAVRFLAQPDTRYRLYLDADRQSIARTGESGDLRDSTGVLKYTQGQIYENSQYVQADVDQDGIVDEQDNCVYAPNVDQKDVDGNGRGDVCDDFDRDGIVNYKDNCTNKPNRAQRDEDLDGIGDVCDSDESRLLEKYQWIPWLGIGSVAVIVSTLIVRTVRARE